MLPLKEGGSYTFRSGAAATLCGPHITEVNSSILDYRETETSAVFQTTAIAAMAIGDAAFCYFVSLMAKAWRLLSWQYRQ